jgi:hypothetical protein
MRWNYIMEVVTRLSLLVRKVWRTVSSRSCQCIYMCVCVSVLSYVYRTKPHVDQWTDFHETWYECRALKDTQNSFFDNFLQQQ